MDMNRKKNWMHPTLYTPPTRLDTPDKAMRDKIVSLINDREPGLWRLVLCLEDSVREHQMEAAMYNLKRILERMDTSSGVSVFVRARNPKVLAQVLELRHVEKLSGFSTPKTDPDEFPRYADQLHGTGFWLMPILETTGMFDDHYRRRLREVLTDRCYKDRIDCVRLGGNDLMGNLGLRRATEDFTIYDVIGGLIEDIVKEFHGLADFNITAPVFEIFETASDDLLRKEVRMNRLLGLYGQTVIHTRHLRIIRDMYKVTLKDMQSAEDIHANHRAKDGKAVTGLHGRMDEPTTHRLWAQRIMLRYRLFGGIWQSETPL